MRRALVNETAVERRQQEKKEGLRAEIIRLSFAIHIPHAIPKLEIVNAKDLSLRAYPFTGRNRDRLQRMPAKHALVEHLPSCARLPQSRTRTPGLLLL